MVLKVFAVRDAKANAFMAPFFHTATGAAVRLFSDGVNDRDTAISRHPDDYQLFQIGEFDDSDGSLTPLDKPIPLGFGSDFVDKSALPFPVVSAVPPKKAS